MDRKVPGGQPTILGSGQAPRREFRRFPQAVPVRTENSVLLDVEGLTPWIIDGATLYEDARSGRQPLHLLVGLATRT